MITTAITFTLGAALGAYITARITRTQHTAVEAPDLTDAADTVARLLHNTIGLCPAERDTIDWLHHNIHARTGGHPTRHPTEDDWPITTATITRPPPGPN